ncbi:homocysteine S-methyltransferase [Fusibacter sp. 3D3]|uniref:homocysteine S-methyltransferase n=1 Tax=Fusibacter sp. 3D3 TaxID=1048380 RepID=UPI000853AE50|nr:homocysteine S-methyltransferase [Fusibacter sp. 3D3]GAU76555.1 homocysteine S-methyltransferase [Fusibacter sp. 3D3]
MNPIERILKDYPMMILDGAFSTELEHKGCDLNDPLWSAKVLIENPDLIAAVHEDYYRAGADCVITASYQATYEGFMKRGVSEAEAGRLIASSVEIAKEVRDQFWSNEADQLMRPKPLVAASVGPYGAYLADGSEYRGNYGLDRAALSAFHEKRMQTLIEAAPDILACETIPCLLEAQAIVDVLSNHPDMYAWISFSAKDGAHINSGEKIEDCARWLNDKSQVAAIGVNCTALEYMTSLIEAIRKGSDKPIVVYPNSGEQYDATQKVWHGCSTSEHYAVDAMQWYEKGAQIIGGCCRTTPKHIYEIAVLAKRQL